ncbi:hypothetical protein CLCY_3c01230 [Clostridium cylindrosporum DSM 605]|uniref:Uncharacterized protein n=1 Tax=Clostridium cylindrosporum DSM 605 TaxID=1121307 RepID=A0A0J8D7I0_CLOCY|nr:hypothetical protein CLCY_3c01230 [Clostridium cylindrosporum DSM 605]
MYLVVTIVTFVIYPFNLNIYNDVESILYVVGIVAFVVYISIILLVKSTINECKE